MRSINKPARPYRKSAALAAMQVGIATANCYVKAMNFCRLLICLFYLAYPLTFAAAQDAAKTYDTFARNAILIDFKSGHVFFEKDADTPVPPASMSKLMTQAIIFDMLAAGELKSEQEFTVSLDATKRGGMAEGSSTMFALPNSHVSVDNLLHAAIVQSANDACIALAEGIAGTEGAFAARMAAKAKDLGLTHSSFSNATGLPDPGQKMSVRDLATLAHYIIANHPHFYKVYGEQEFTWNKITQQNRNPLLKDYPGADGMKTGYTKEAGYGLVGSAVRDGRRLILVIAGLDKMEKRKLEAQKLLDYGFSQFKTVSLYEPGDVVSRVRVWGGEESWVNLQATSPFRVSLAPFEQEAAEVRMSFKGPLLAPLKAGTVVGAMRVFVDGIVVSEAPVQIGADVAESHSMWQKAEDSALMMLFGG